MNSRPHWIPLWVIPVLVGMSIGTVWLRLSIVRMTYSVSQTDRMIRNLQHERERAEFKLAQQRSPRRLEALARGKYGLSQPRADQVIYIQ